MEEINKKIGKNLLILRKNSKLTQMELAEKFNYSDKSISKWETGESLPSIEILNDLAKFYNVSLDNLINSDEILTEKKPNESSEKPKKMFPTKLIITLLSVSAVWIIATLVFVCLKIFLNINYGLCFLWALPVSCIVLIVFNGLWGRFRYLFFILSFMLWTLLVCLQLQILFPLNINIWPIYILGVPLQVAIILWGALVKKDKRHIKKVPTEKDATN